MEGENRLWKKDQYRDPVGCLTVYRRAETEIDVIKIHVASLIDSFEKLTIKGNLILICIYIEYFIDEENLSNEEKFNYVMGNLILDSELISR